MAVCTHTQKPIMMKTRLHFKSRIIIIAGVCFLLFFMIPYGYSQAPEKFSYQAVIRDNLHQLVANQPVRLRISILQGSENGTPVYVETQIPLSNANGLISIEVGAGSVVSGNFGSIDWSSGAYFIKTEADPTGGQNYSIEGVSRLISVPYAMHANTAENVTGPVNETDPVFSASVAAGITVADTVYWNAKLDAESDPLFSAWDKSTGITITESQVTDLQPYLVSENDPLFGASVAAGITSGDTALWNAKLDTESDPLFGASVAAGITSGDTAQWNAKLDTESDPLFTAWDKSTGISITESQVNDLQPYLLTESDPLFISSVASGITSSDTASWNRKVDATPATPGEMLYWNGQSWISVPPGQHGQVLTFCHGIPTWGPCPALPGQPSTIIGPVDVCEYETGLVYHVIQDSGVTYTWTVPSGWSITSGQGTHEINVTAGVDSGVIEVIPSTQWGAGPAQQLAVATQVCGAVFPPGYTHCNPGNPTAIVDVVNPVTGKVWMDRNLGAEQVATSPTDHLAYGDLYQWGRFADGHQCRNASTNTTLSTNDQPQHNEFILSSTAPNDWRSPQNDNLWQGVQGVNNPCPSGYRLPTEAELNTERASWSHNNMTGAFNSPLKLTASGSRNNQNGALANVGAVGLYWSSNIDNTFARYLSVFCCNASLANSNRATGLSVRCIKE